jgi:ATP/maltotriose-dependent transcriptional regulator MalT/predicted ATPase
LQGQRSEAEVRQVLAETLDSHRYLVEYLGEEVFSHQPEVVQSFLLHTCILERFSAPLCAAVSGGDLEECAAILASLERENLFLVPLDARGDWYRFHPLWASVLRVLLVRTLGAEGAAALAGRASRWYEQQDLPAEAIEAAIVAGEFERAVALVEQRSTLLLDRSQYYTLRRWIEQLPREQWTARPIVCLAYAWALFLSGAHDAYAAPLEEAEQLFRGAESSIGVGMVQALRSLAALLWMDEREAQRASQQALALLPDSDRNLRALCSSILGGSHYLLGEVELAWQQLAEARRLQEQSSSLSALLLNMTIQANVLAAQGRLHEAVEGYQQVIEVAAESRADAIDATIRQAAIFYEWNDFERAEAQLAGILEESQTLVATTFFARGALSLVYLVQARIRQARGKDEEASARLRQAVTLARQRQHLRFLAQAQAAQVRFRLAHGQMEAVMRWREEEGRAIDTTPGYLNEPEGLTLARVQIAEGEPEDALRLLESFRVRARTQRRLSSELEILVLCALAEDVQGQAEQAVQHLEQALVLAEPQGYVRLFVDEGAPMLSLLRQVAARWIGTHGAGYVRRLLSVLETEHPEQAEPLPSLQMPVRQRDPDAYLHNLPVQPTRSIGREQDIAQVRRQLRRPEVGLLTLTGPGGVGKTRLALEVAQDLLPDFANGVCFVPLSAIREPDLVLPAIAQALGLRQSGARPLLEQLQAALGEQSLLLLLDNFEQVLPAAPRLAELLSACPHVRLLVTSRAALRLLGEHELAVSPLALPSLAQLPAPDALSQYGACALFVERVQAIQQDFALTAATTNAIAEICLRLDGLPLAIELAAARSRLLTPQALLSRLAQPLSVLTGGTRDAPERQQTMRATIDWSYQLLAPEEQRLFRSLSVFAGGCTLQAVEAMAEPAGLLASHTLDGVSALLENHLLRKLEQPDGEPRLSMLETIREFGLERLERSGELEVARAAHAAYYLALAEEIAPHLRGSEQARFMAHLEREQENLRAALGSLLEQAHTQADMQEGARAIQQALRLCVALHWFWHDRGSVREGLHALTQALAAPAGVVPSLRARALQAAAELANSLDDMERSETWCGEVLSLSREVGDTAGIASSLRLLGGMARVRGQYTLACSRLEEAASLFGQLGDGWMQGRCQVGLARTATEQGQYERALALLEDNLQFCQQAGNQVDIHWVEYLLARLLFVQQADLAAAQRLVEQSLAFFQEGGYSWHHAYMLTLLAQLRLVHGEVALARAWLEESLVLVQKVGDREGALDTLLSLARVALFQDDPTTARRRYQEALTILQEMGSQAFLADCLEGMAAGAVAAQAADQEPSAQTSWAVQLWGAAARLREAMGTPLPPVNRPPDEQARAEARSRLGDHLFAAAWAEGRAMTPEQAIAAEGKTRLSAGAAAAAPLPKRPSPFGLTARELDVLRLLAQGLSDVQIAEQLVIARRTVNWYLTSIYSKLGVSSRAAATRTALEQRLL